LSERINKILEFLKANPADCFLNHALALEYVKVGEEDNAMRRFELNLANDPTYVATYYHLGKLLERTGQPDNAVIIYERGMAAAKTAKDEHSYNELQAVYEDLAY
jgi:tetratricopeptide (TPR) repeat protein